MIAIGIDQSITKTAITVFEEDTPQFYLFFGDKYLSEAGQIALMVYNIEKLVQDKKPDFVCLEALPFGAISTSVRILAGLYYGICIILEKHNINYYSISSTVFKKEVLAGNALKTELLTKIPNTYIQEILKLVEINSTKKVFNNIQKMLSEFNIKYETFTNKEALRKSSNKGISDEEVITKRQLLKIDSYLKKTPVLDLSDSYWIVNFVRNRDEKI